MHLSAIQKVVAFFTSKDTFTKMQEESCQWRFSCKCGCESSIWQAGGIRYKASGTPFKKVRCPYCETVAIRRIYKAKTELCTQENEPTCFVKS